MKGAQKMEPDFTIIETAWAWDVAAMRRQKPAKNGKKQSSYRLSVDGNYTEKG